MTGQEKCDCLIEVTAWAGLTVSMFLLPVQLTNLLSVSFTNVPVSLHLAPALPSFDLQFSNRYNLVRLQSQTSGLFDRSLQKSFIIIRHALLYE